MTEQSPAIIPEINVGVKVKAQQLVLQLTEATEKLKGTNKALKSYREDSEEMKVLKAQRTVLNLQIKEEREEMEDDFMKDEDYRKLREEKLDHEEKKAVAKQDLKTLLIGEAKEGEAPVSYDLQINGKMIKLQAQLSLNLFFNGKEEK